MNCVEEEEEVGEVMNMNFIGGPWENPSQELSGKRKAKQNNSDPGRWKLIVSRLPKPCIGALTLLQL